MKRLIGFKGRYFRLSAIAALNGSIRIAEDHVRTVRHHRCQKGGETDERSEEPPPLELSELYEAVTTRVARKACHCNCIFRRKFRRLWHLYKFFFTPPGRYFKTKTGTSPPYFLFS
ncbi:hypothetical protein [Nitratifractor salsuginis]|uniref:Uncharacterized protein n=1 Tax=Nitratifractor salsuginis (strain DSM 16511 / JCM 12458 / E9I37-1) TaxID=749222 RepID=E6WXV1_NITSE|nr:hypothetical protein [Nitratifractor salsuginis]ADV46358.1 hypothetical protein Nitsa_1104 [Nitratifractor salsuginis DSM 16511]